jgi:hypothetical protein
VGGTYPLHRMIVQHIGAAILGKAGTNDAAGIGAQRGGHGRVDGDHDTGERRGILASVLVDETSAEQGVGIVIDKLAMEFLAGEL